MLAIFYERQILISIKQAKGTGGSPTPTFLPKMFTHSIDRLQSLVENENLPWADKLIDIMSNHETAMQQFQKIAMQSEN